jgi:hypothetical protein
VNNKSALAHSRREEWNLMRTVLIIGAGATRAEAKVKRCPLKRLPPLDTDFFQLCKYHKVKDNLEALKRYIKKEYLIDITKPPHPRMEEIFGLVYSDTRLKPVPANAREAYVALCRMYNRVILETTNPLNPSKNGPLIKLIKSVLSKGSCCIIIFNHDILIEKALSNIDKKILGGFLILDTISHLRCTHCLKVKLIIFSNLQKGLILK